MRHPIAHKLKLVNKLVMTSVAAMASMMLWMDGREARGMLSLDAATNLCIVVQGGGRFDGRLPFRCSYSINSGYDIMLSIE